MARKNVVVFVDDMTGDEIPEKDVRHVAFSIDGVDYVMDLSPESHDEWVKDVSDWVEVATRVSPQRRAARRDLNKVREWARSEGLEVSDRGRVSKKIIEAYDARRA